jgi:hypothetical protein
VSLLPALVGLLLARAGAVEPTHAQAVYDVQIAGAAAGTRTVAWTWMPVAERRVITQHTRATLLGKPLETRCTASISRRGSNVTCASAHGDDAWEVQAQGSEGRAWSVRVRDRGGDAPSAPVVTLTTVELFDAARVSAVLGRAEPGQAVSVLVAETGEVVTGTLAVPTAVEVRVGGQPRAATRHELRASAGGLVVDVDADGALLRAELRTALGAMTLTAQAAPPAREWGALEGLELDGGVREAP